MRNAELNTHGAHPVWPTMSLNLPSTLSASQLLDGLIRLQHDPRLRDLLGPSPLDGITLRAEEGVLVADLAEPPDDASPEAQTVRDALRDAFARALEPQAPPTPSDPRSRTRPARAADPNPHAIAARAHLDAGNPGRALEVVEAALPRWPQSRDLHVFHALTLAALARPEEAIGAYREVIRLDPRSAFAHTGAAELCAGLGHWEDALAHAKQALDLDPQDALCMKVLALANEHLGLPREAVESMRKALTLEPQLPGGTQDLERMERALAEDVDIALSPSGPSPVHPPPPLPLERQPMYPPLDVSLDATDPYPAKASQPPPTAQAAPSAVAPPPQSAPSPDARWGVAARQDSAPPSRECQSCRTANSPRVSFCIRCGAKLGDE